MARLCKSEFASKQTTSFARVGAEKERNSADFGYRDNKVLRVLERERLQKNGKSQILVYILLIITSIIKFQLSYDFIAKIGSKGRGFWLY